MSDFKAKMHQIRFPETPLQGELTALPQTRSCIKGPTSKRREGKGVERKGEEGKGKGREGERREMEGEGTGGAHEKCEA